MQCGDGGACQPSGYCSFPDTDCDSGQAYGNAAPPSLAGECVPVEQDTDDASSSAAGVSGSDTSVDGGADGSSTTASMDDDEGGGDTLELTSGASTSDGPSTSGGLDGSSTSGDGSGSSSSGGPVTRVTEGLLLLYDFSKGEVDVVEDLSGVDPLMPGTVQPDQGSPSWGPDGLVFSGAGIVVVEGSSSKVLSGLQQTNTMTVEAWLTPSEVTQEGPARIVTLSLDSTERAFTLGHGGSGGPTDDFVGESYVTRLRTTDTGGVNGNPPLVTDPMVELQLTHVVTTHDEDSELAIWVDGVLVASDTRMGTYDDWPTDYVFGVGNEITLGRPYLGTIHLVAVYDRALAPDEIQQNLDAGF